MGISDTKMSIYQTFWIDLGNVLFFFDYALFLDKIKQSLSVPLSEVQRLIVTGTFVQDFERGLIGEEEFFQHFKTHTGMHIHKDYFFESFSDIFWENAAFIQFVRRHLKPRYRLVLLSNINKVHFSFLEHNYPEVFRLFDALVLSCTVNALKPEPAIYAAALEASESTIEQVLYIDDRQELIDAASAQGIPSVCFRGTQDCIAELNKKGVVA